MTRRILLTLTFAVCCLSSYAASPRFTLWQLPSQGPSQMNSYVIQTSGGQVAVIDGGMTVDAPYLRGFLAALGNRVEWWFVTHPHADHIGALIEILRSPNGIAIGTVCHSPMTPHQLASQSAKEEKDAGDYFDALAASGIKVVEPAQAGFSVRLDELNVKVLRVNDPSIVVNTYNNSCMVLRLWDKHKSFLMLADLGLEAGEKLLQNAARGDLDCDYIQMSHHGQNGVSEEFYRTVKFRACLWPTPLWLWNNDAGGGYGTGPFKTLDTRRWMDEKGISEHYCEWEGLVKIE